MVDGGIVAGGDGRLIWVHTNTTQILVTYSVFVELTTGEMKV